MRRVQLQQFIDLTQSKGLDSATAPSLPQSNSQQDRTIHRPERQTQTDRSSGVKLDRRSFFSVAASLAALTSMAPTAFARNFGQDAEPQRYPDPDIVVLDKRFKYKIGNTPIQRLYRGTLWAEGPAWSGVGRYLLWSDIPNNEQLRWLEEDGYVARRFRFPPGIVMEIRSIFRAARSPVSTELTGSFVMSWMGASPSLPRTSMASRSTPPMMLSSIPTMDLSGLPIPVTVA